MGSLGFHRAADLRYLPGEIILEVGSSREEGSTAWLAKLAPVVTIDVDPAAYARVVNLPNVEARLGLAEEVLRWWTTPIRFAWLDGHDWPYSHHPPSDWEGQRREYHARGQEYSQQASQQSHLQIARLIVDAVVLGGHIAFDDTWDQPSDLTSGGWNGKGGTAVPYLLDRGYRAVYSGDIYDGLAILEASP